MNPLLIPPLAAGLLAAAFGLSAILRFFIHQPQPSNHLPRLFAAALLAALGILMIQATLS